MASSSSQGSQSSSGGFLLGTSRPSIQFFKIPDPEGGALPIHTVNPDFVLWNRQDQFLTLKKGAMSIEEYIVNMRNIVDSINSTRGQVILDDELVLYILAGLGNELNLWSFISQEDKARFLLRRRNLCYKRKKCGLSIS
ncbi:hypothetical protein TIFTF001_018559 [Ficus carica]|uniref:Uncharacterized protein n=1 Tax=Ficus carica TaxID=3494 RepID=A0AA88ACN7_FICCA|nr:hypothetical protein TIFTF001_018559 [Ficus carica]